MTQPIISITPVNTLSHSITSISGKETNISSLTAAQKKTLDDNFNNIKINALAYAQLQDSDYFTKIDYSKGIITLTDKTDQAQTRTIVLRSSDPNLKHILSLAQESLGIINDSKDAKRFKILSSDSAGNYNELKNQKIVTIFKNFSTNFIKLKKEITPIINTLFKSSAKIDEFNNKFEKAKEAHDILNKTIDDFLRNKPSLKNLKKQNALLANSDNPNKDDLISANNEIILAYEYKEMLSQLDPLCLVMALAHSDEKGNINSSLKDIHSSLKKSDLNSSWKTLLGKFLNTTDQTKDYAMKVLNTIATKDKDQTHIWKTNFIKHQNRNPIEQIIMASIQSNTLTELETVFSHIDHRLHYDLFNHTFTNHLSDAFTNFFKPQSSQHHLSSHASTSSFTSQSSINTDTNVDDDDDDAFRTQTF